MRTLIFSLLISFFSCIFSLPVESQVASSQAIQDLLNDEALKSASVGVYAYNLSKEERVLSYNPNKALIPASIQKLVTTASAYIELGADHKFETYLAYQGDIDKEGILEGDVVIIGGGDPTLGSSHFGKNKRSLFMNKWAKKLKNKGIKEVNGQIVVDASLFDKHVTPKTWIWGDIGNYFGAFPSSLSIYDNAYKVYFDSRVPLKKTVNISRIEPELSGIEIQNQVKAYQKNKDNAYFYSAPYSEKVYMDGEIPVDREEFIVKGAIQNPPKIFINNFEKVLKDHDITFNKENTKVHYNPVLSEDQPHFLDTVYSPPLRRIIKKTNHKSINLFAEHLLLHAMGKENIEDGAKALKEYWQKKDVLSKSANIKDGSGLSRYNSISVKNICNVLKYMKDDEKYSSFKTTLPVMGQTGTLSNTAKGTLAEGKINAKSGYMERVRSYAGYGKNKKGEDIVFTIIVNNYSCSAYEMKKKLVPFMVSLVGGG
ncbi:MAG: D-alanyl-D-alanine carboxypeptidase/D-alanyl-D-alanine-endopeptidase [Flavobacteriales bacterium]